MVYKLNIIDPWESGTESAINASIVKEMGNQFLLLLTKPIKIKGKDAKYLVGEFRRTQDKISFKNHVKGTYPINIVFDKNITDDNSNLYPLSNYRANFLSGEIII